MTLIASTIGARADPYISSALVLGTRVLLLRPGLLGVESRVLHCGRGVVAAGLAVLVRLGLQRVLVLGIFAGEEAGRLRERASGDGSLQDAGAARAQ